MQTLGKRSFSSIFNSQVLTEKRIYHPASLLKNFTHHKGVQQQRRRQMINQKKLLVLIDGSERSMKTVDYVSRVTPFLHYKVTLYHVFSGVPDGFYDLEKEPANAKAVTQLKDWETQKKKDITAFMSQAQEILIKAGFPAEAVEIKIHTRTKGIARDILTEAEQGYSAVVLRRRGVGALEGVTIGSVASKLIAKISFLPVIIAGQRLPGEQILIGVDGSEYSARAVDFVAKIFGGYGYRVELLHVIRGFDGMAPEGPDFMMHADYLHEVQSRMTQLFASLRQKLIQAGFETDKISEKIITGVFSRAGTIVKEAEAQGCGTIVVGRKGLSSVQEFFMGRVSNKVIHAGRKFTVWIV